MNQRSVRSPSVPLQPAAGWEVLFGPAGEDGAVILNPFDVDLFEPQAAFLLNRVPYSWPTQQGGRLFVFPEHHTGRLEVWPNFTEDGASATVQLFAFTHTLRSQAKGEDKSLDDVGNFTNMIGSDDQPNGSPNELSSVALGPAYCICRDASGSPSTLTFTASDGETNNIVVPSAFEQKGSLTTSDVSPSATGAQIEANTLNPDGQPGIAYHVLTGGTNFVSAPREIFDAAGFSALFAWVSDVTVGQLLLLARVI